MKDETTGTTEDDAQVGLSSEERAPLSDLLCAGHAVVKDEVVYNIEEKLFTAEEYEACMMAMDKKGVPRHDSDGVIYSIWGRACWMGRNAVTGT